MSFKPESVEQFLSQFEENKKQIRNFEGCEYLELLRDKDNTQRFFTYSHWSDATALEKYRQSPLFKEVWAKTKVLFNEKPEAWSCGRDQVAGENAKFD